jgi:DNA-binding beta-propeller fold protein YncE
MAMSSQKILAGALFILAALFIGLMPVAADETSPTQAYVVNTGDSSVSLVDLQAGKEVRRFEVGPSPYGVAVSADGKRVAIGVEGEGKVKFFDTTNFSQLAEVKIGDMHHDHIVLTKDGKHILDANFHSDTVVGINFASMKEDFRITGYSAPHVVKYGPLGKQAFVTCKKITGIAIIDPADRKLVKFHQINVNPRSLTFSPDESKVYFGSFWVDGFLEMESQTGKVTRLFALPPPADNTAPQEVTYHGVEAVGPNIVLAANEGRSYVDSVDVQSGKLLDRLTGVSKPCCIERIPGTTNGAVRVLVSNIGDGTLELVEVSAEGKLTSLKKIAVGKSPKRVAFVPVKSDN